MSRHLGKLVVPVNTAQPSSPLQGQVYFDSDGADLQLYVYNGTSWDTVATVNTAQTFTGQKTFNSPVLSGQTAGANQATPAYSFSADPNTGIYSSAADVLDFSTGGARRLSLATGAVTVTDSGGLFIDANTNNVFGQLTIKSKSSLGVQHTGAMWVAASNGIMGVDFESTLQFSRNSVNVFSLVSGEARVNNGADLVAQAFAGAPSTSPSDGAIAVDTTNSRLYFRSGGAWTPVSTSSSATTTKTASVAFIDGDTMRRVTISDSEVVSASNIVGSVRRPNVSDSADRGYLYEANIVQVNNGSFDVLISATAWGYDDPTGNPPNETVEYIYTIDATSSTAIPAGVMELWPGSSAPNGWFLCQGQETSIATYGALYAVLGTTYGTLTNGSGGAGSTHFRLPDMRGRVAVGVGTATGAPGATAHTLGQKAGSETHQLSVSELPAHSHQPRSKVANGGGQIMFDFTPSDGNVQNIGPVTGTTGNDVPHLNMQPYVGLNYIIKY